MSGIEWSKAPWDGTGLPPVGTVCEVFPHNSQWGFSTIEPRCCTVLGYHTDFVWLDLGIPGTPVSTRIDKVDFAIIRTPEQIAAEEREKAIKEMADAARCSGMPWIERFGVLYDAGYRKTEAP